MTSITQVQPMSDDYLPPWPTPESVAYHRAKAAEERERAMAECPGLGFRADGAPVVKADVLPFLHRHNDELFTAPQRWDLLQTRESNRAGDLAEDIAHAAYNRDVSELGRREQALCRYLATHALRMTHDNWKVAALGEAMDAVQRWMREDAGSAFRHLSDAHHEAIAAFLVPVVVTAYLGITEGTIALEPGRYLGIVNGEGI